MILVKKAGSREMTQFCHSNYAKETQTAVQSILSKGVKAGDLVGRNRLLRWYLWLCYSQRFCSLVWRSSVKYKKRNILLLFFLFFFFLVKFSGHTAEYNRKSYSYHTFLYIVYRMFVHCV